MNNRANNSDGRGELSSDSVTSHDLMMFADGELDAQREAAVASYLRENETGRAVVSTVWEMGARIRELQDRKAIDAGADGMVLGFLNGLGEVDAGVITELIGDAPWPWTFSRAIDACLDSDRGWAVLASLPRLDQVLTAGSARGVDHGLDELVDRATGNPWAARVMMAGGGLRPEHVPWLARAGVTAFQIGRPARAQGSYKAYVDEGLVRSWRTLIDTEVRHRPSR